MRAFDAKEAHAALQVAPPIVVQNPDEEQWDDSADLVVVGYGLAGAAAAVQAAESGLEALVIDRFEGGGTSAWSGGVLYASATRQQASEDIEDTPEEMAKYLEAEGNLSPMELLREFSEASSENLEWVAAKGVPFGGNLFQGKTAYPPEGHFLFWSGNERLPNYASKAKPAPRGHKTAVTGYGGATLFGKVRESGRQLGVRELLHSPARRMIVDTNGRVVGVEVESVPPSEWLKHGNVYKKNHPMTPFSADKAQRAVARATEIETKTGSRKRIRAREGVVLATGGFSYNLRMLDTYNSVAAKNYKGMLRMDSVGSDGSGVDLGRSVGGATEHMTRVYIGRPLSPPEAYIFGIMINVNGERFVAEDVYQSIFGEALSQQPLNGKGWLVLDNEHFWKAVKQSLAMRGVEFLYHGMPTLANIIFAGTKRGRTLAKLARKCGIPPGTLEATVQEFNAAATQGGPDKFGKSIKLLAPLGKGPYYAVNFSLGNAFNPAFLSTLGGLAVSHKTSQVIDDNERPIEGLYAAGRAAAGILSTSHASGISLSEALFTGRRAAFHAAGALTDRPSPAHEDARY